MINLILAFFTSLLVVIFAIPTIRMVSSMKNLYDIPEERKLHTTQIPRLGGLAIFAAFFFSSSLWGMWDEMPRLQYFEAALFALFFSGLKDDLVKLTPHKKLFSQVVAAGIVMIGDDIRISSLYGIFGIYEIPYWISLLITLFTFIVVTNSFNLIDGIDGLAGGIGLICSLTFALWFNYIGATGWSVMAFCVAGALLGFLFYNFNPAKIFMGDSGALIVGFMMTVFALQFIQINNSIPAPLHINNSPSVAIAILIIPLADTLRVFIIRLSRKQSPFKADTNHIHHSMLKLGLNHAEISLLMYLINIIFVIIAFIMRDANVSSHLLTIAGIAFVLSMIPGFLAQQMRNESSFMKEQEIKNARIKRGEL